MTAVHAVGAALCALVDCIQPVSEGINTMPESKWNIIIPSLKENCNYLFDLCRFRQPVDNTDVF